MTCALTCRDCSEYIKKLERVAVAAEGFVDSLMPMNQKGHDGLIELKESLQALRGKETK